MTDTKELAVRVLAQANILKKLGNHHCSSFMVEASERLTIIDTENKMLLDPDWETYIAITKVWLANYPPDIFTGVSGDSGPLFVVAVRNALVALEGSMSTIRRAR